MRHGILRILDVPEEIEGHAGVNVKEQALLIGEELIRQKERRESTTSDYFNPPLINLMPQVFCVPPIYYDQMVQVYQTILTMTREIMVGFGTTRVNELRRQINDYIDYAGRLKKEVERRGRRMGIPTHEGGIIEV